MSVENMYAALLKIAVEDEYKYRDLGVDMKSDESGVEKDDKKRKKQREQSEFISPAGAGTAAGVLGALGVAAATPGGRKALKGVKGGMEAAVAKVINKIREAEAPKNPWTADYALLPALGGDVLGGLLINRAYGLGATPARRTLVSVMLEQARKAHLEERFDDEALLASAVEQLRRPRNARAKIVGRDSVFPWRRVQLEPFDRRIIDNPRLRELLSDEAIGTSKNTRLLRGHLPRPARRIVGGLGMSALLAGNIWSGINVARNYEKQKGRAH